MNNEKEEDKWINIPDVLGAGRINLRLFLFATDDV
jgi:hypothetical protein